MTKKLYELELQVAELRKNYIGYIENITDITLKKVLDFGFNNVYINGIAMYKDRENKYIANGFYINNKELLNAEIEYLENDFDTNGFGDYLVVYCKFKDEKYNKVLDNLSNGDE